jgi:hypothetical protein
MSEMSKIEFVYHYKKENKGRFEFSDDSFRFKSPLNDIIIPYNDVVIIERVWGTRKEQIVIVTAEYYDSNCYKITIIGGRSMFLQVSFAEQDDFVKRLKKLNRKIYGGNRLGVGLVSKIPDNATLKKKDAQFEQERPYPDYTLTQAIVALSERCGKEIIDTTAL